MFDIYKILPKTTWFDDILYNSNKVNVCKKSGDKASVNCDDIDTVYLNNEATKAKTCNYHYKIHLDSTQKYQVNSDCYNVHDIKLNLGLYYLLLWNGTIRKNIRYNELPPLLDLCNKEIQNPMQLIYPRVESKIYIPKDIDGKIKPVIFKAAHRFNETTIYWHLDDNYLGKTSSFHHFKINTKKGFHTITLIDEKGNIITKDFEILSDN